MALQIPVWERYARQIDVTASPRIGNKGNMGRNSLHTSCKQENKKIIFYGVEEVNTKN